MEMKYMEWQPIETAPKDGTVILVCDVHFYIVFWEHGGWDTGFSDRCDDPITVQPTHWMPLPHAIADS